MKLTTIDKVREAVETLEPRVEVPEDVRTAALAAVERMIAIG
jgi:quinolinate synthase